MSAPCSAHASEYLLPSSYVGHADLQCVQHVNLEVPNIPKIFNESLFVRFQKAQNKSVLDNILKRLQKIQQSNSLSEIELELLEIEKKEDVAKTSWPSWWDPNIILAPTTFYFGPHSSD